MRITPLGWGFIAASHIVFFFIGAYLVGAQWFHAATEAGCKLP